LAKLPAAAVEMASIAAMARSEENIGLEAYLAHVIYDFPVRSRHKLGSGDGKPLEAAAGKSWPSMT
jgi:hypothetical protein